VADSAAARDPSYSTSRRASPRGLGYFYSTTWEAASLKSISGHILQDDPSIREGVPKYLLAATCAGGQQARRRVLVVAASAAAPAPMALTLWRPGVVEARRKIRRLRRGGGPLVAGPTCVVIFSFFGFVCHVWQS
jgi:hypothetical protein